jgi:hypothetical protein
VRTSSRVELRFRRAGQETRVELESVFVETKAGEPVEASVAQGGGAAVRYRFAKESGAWVATIDRGAAGVGERKKIEGDFLTPRAASALVAARHEAGAAEIGFRAIDVQSGLSVAEIVMTRGAVDGARTRYATRNSLVPVVGSELLDAAGRSVETTVDFPGLGEFRSRLADKAAADQAAADSDRQPSADRGMASLAGVGRAAAGKAGVRGRKSFTGTSCEGSGGAPSSRARAA